MMSFFHNVIYLPIYNLVVFLAEILPGADLGLAVIGATLIVKLILVPVSISAIKTQRAMRIMEPELKDIRERLKDDKEKQAREMLALYKKYGAKPFSSILMLFIQIPIVLGLYFVCLNIAKGIDPSLIYAFIPAPEALSPLFLGIFSVAGPSIFLAIVAGLTQLAQAFYAIPVPAKSTNPNPPMQEEFGRAMALQARYVFPVLIGLFAYTSGAIAIYFAASNLFMLAQEFLVRKFMPNVPAPEVSDTLPVPAKAN